ncbi:MAG: hypothetical protein U0904_12190 [Candidatus Nanopelagicales bacterium]|nr:hypothetical protein [Candidatus Nanopelagicales bacterium]
MELATLIVSVIAVLVAAYAAVNSVLARKASQRSATASETSAESSLKSSKAAADADLRARTPQIRAALAEPDSSTDNTWAKYVVTTSGPTDIDSVVLQVPGSIPEPVALRTPGGDWMRTLGIDSLNVGSHVEIELCFGNNARKQPLSLRVTCCAGEAQWGPLLVSLDLPPRPPTVYAF